MEKTKKIEFIFEAAARIFREKGYHKANMTDIAKEVGILKGSLYHHISSKNELLFEIVMSVLDNYIIAIEKVLSSDETPDILLQKAIHSHLSGNYNKLLVFVNERRNLAAHYLKLAEKGRNVYEEKWLKLLEKGKKADIFRHEIDSKIIMMQIFGMCNSTLSWYKHDGKYSTSELSEMYASTILNGIKK